MHSGSEGHLQSPPRVPLHASGGTDLDADRGARPNQNMQILTMKSRGAKRGVVQARVLPLVSPPCDREW